MSKKIVGINLIPKWKDWHNKYCYIAEVEEIEDKPKETLEEKIKVYLGTPSPVCPDGKVSEHISKIAKDYFKEHPEEIDCVHIKCADESLSHVKGMVSLDKVLAVFDAETVGHAIETTDPKTCGEGINNHIRQIRKALEGMGETKKIKREGDEPEYVRKSEVLVAFDNARLNTFVKGSNKEDGLNFIRDILVANF